MGLSIKKIRYANFCADQIDDITNLAGITNVVKKRVLCITCSSCQLASNHSELKVFSLVSVPVGR